MRTFAHFFYLGVAAFASAAVGCGSDDPDSPSDGQGGTSTTLAQAGSGGGGTAPLRENGETCSTHTECASAFCTESQVGERRCYGDGAANDVCGDTFDCSIGACVERSLGPSQSVCIPAIVFCQGNDVPDACVEYNIAFCQFIQFCGEDTSSNIPPEMHDFNYCIGNGCFSANDGVSDMTPAECLSAVNFIDSGAWPCP